MIWPSHEAVTVQSTYPRGDEWRGKAQSIQSSQLHDNASSPVGTRHWALGKGLCISDLVLENVKMQAVTRLQRRLAHEAQQEGPLCVKPWPITKLPEDDFRRDALPVLAELTKESHLNSQHVLELWTLLLESKLGPEPHTHTRLWA